MAEASQTEETKSQTTESQEPKTTAESPATTPTPKKRGRPRKAPVPEGETPPKRRRGRPRKSETEAKAAAESATAAGAASPASSGADTPKKKRGRPKKEPGSEGPPKKRGRPRKVREEGAEAKPNDTTPKKRGRPRKSAATPSPGGTAASPAPAPAASTAPITGETKESDAVHEPRMESRKRRRNASKSPVREKKSSKKESARKKLKYTEEDTDKLDLGHLDRHSLQELQTYAREQKINMKLHGDRKGDFIHAILLKHFSSLTFDELKAEASKRDVDMDDYGNTNKRKMDYIHALIDNSVGQEGEPLWELWKEIYLVGTEWENYDSVFDVNWDFDHLKEALEEGGDLYTAGSEHAVYLFGVTEPQLVKFEEKDRVVPIPAIVAVISSLPPPAELGLKSVQKIPEEFVPMKELKMDWVPYIPKSEWKKDPKKVVPRAFFLKTHQRREGLKDMKEEEVVKFNFALPYIFLPRAQEEPTSDDTVVSVSTDVVNGKCITFEFDWEMDEVEEIATDVLKDNDVNPAKNKEKLNDLIKAIKDTVNAEKQRIRDEKAKWRSRIESLSAAQKKALDELKIWKFYPQNDYPDVSNNKVAFVNRYYGKADKVL